MKKTILFFIIVAFIPIIGYADVYSNTADIETFLCQQNKCTHFFLVTNNGSVIKVGDIIEIAKDYDEAVARQTIHHVGSADYLIRYGGYKSIKDITPGIYRSVTPKISGYRNVKKISNIATMEELQRQRMVWLTYNTSNFPKRLDEVQIFNTSYGFSAIIQLFILGLLFSTLLLDGTLMETPQIAVNRYNFSSLIGSIFALLLLGTTVFDGQGGAFSYYLTYLQDIIGKAPIWSPALIILSLLINKKAKIIYTKNLTVTTFSKILNRFSMSISIATIILFFIYLIGMSSY